VRGRKLLLVGLAMILALGCLLVAACGGSGGKDSTATMKAALDVIETDISSLTTMMMSGGKTADGVADNADLMTLAAAVMAPVTALQAYEQELRGIVGPSEGK
jgi:ABC-type oligopeptide transport system substrate-binding subunit